ncbi:MAG: Hsp20/alpha crystallin family protein [Planctomycetota bacterium]
MKFSLMRRPSDLLGGVLGRDFRSFFEPFLDAEALAYRESFLPPADIFHDDEKVTVRVEVPGVKKEDLDVHIEGDLLTISGKKEHIESSNYHQIETRCGAFHRAVTLPHTVDRDKIAASYGDGVLTLTLPLAAEVKPKQIEIKVN